MSFIVVPKDLFSTRYNNVSAEAKLLYGFLSDRSKLSAKNGDAWLDQNKECFVYYPVAEITERFACGHDKASRLLRELENAGLLERTRQGLGRPQRLVVKPVAQVANDPGCLALKSRGVERGNVATNNTYENNLDNNTEPTLWMNKKTIEQQIKENICYDVLSTEVDLKTLDSIVEVIVQTLCSSAKTIRISGQEQSMLDVQHHLMALNDIHLRYVIDRIALTECVIVSPKGYILRHLFYADQEMDIYYASRVAQDERLRRNSL